MKKTKEHLDDMLGLVKEYQPAEKLVSHDELIGMLNNPSLTSVKTDWESQQINQSKKRKNMITISSIILAGIGTVLFWSSPQVELGNKNIKADPISIPDEQEHPYQRESITTLNGIVPNNVVEDIRLNGNRDNNRKTFVVPGYSISDLSVDELKKIGLVYQNNRVEYEEETELSTQEVPPSRLRKFEKLGYDVLQDDLTLRLKTTLDFSSGGSVSTAPVEPSSQEVGLAPVASILVRDQEVVIASYTGDEQLYWLLQEEKELLQQEIFSLGDTLESVDRSSSGILDKFITVHIPHTHQNDKGKEEQIHIYLWYAPSVDLLQALPARHRMQELADRVEYVLSFPKNTQEVSSKGLLPGNLVMRRTSSYPELRQYDRTQDIQGVNVLDLTERELEQLDVNFQREGMVFTMEQLVPVDKQVRSLGYDTEASLTPVRFQVSLDTFSIKYDPIQMSRAQIHTPVLVSNSWIRSGDKETRGSGLDMIFSTDAPVLNKLGEEGYDLGEGIDQLYLLDKNDVLTEEEIVVKLASLNKLIPVRVQMTSDEFIAGADRYQGAEVFLWYVPTPQLIDALPERYRDPLKRELDAIAAVEAEGLPSYEVCDRIAGESTFLDVCRSSAGAVEGTTVWPNPAKKGGENNNPLSID